VAKCGNSAKMLLVYYATTEQSKLGDFIIALAANYWLND